mmetsp:Transcript_11454/g.25143  ORF Transcript_11454/g.25143 Transcript_11454/m.25143 type:complete len:84 (-) Transcript_11454:1328-1579(-)
MVTSSGDNLMLYKRQALLANMRIILLGLLLYHCLGKRGTPCDLIQLPFRNHSANGHSVRCRLFDVCRRAMSISLDPSTSNPSS